MDSYRHYADLRKDLIERKTTCVEQVEACLKNIREYSHLNAVLEVWADEALEQAHIADARISENKAGRLAGIVIVLKDNICYKNHSVSASSRILNPFTSVYSATVTERLLAEGAIIIGRANCDEFAMGASNENSAYGPVLNGLDSSRVPGGSSGGSAVAVQMGMCHAALGSDTGGSIRQPAAFCGLTGYKPSYGLVSRWGLLAYASSFDQIGPLTRSVEDTALILDVIAGPDEHDATASQHSHGPYNGNPSEGVKKIAYIRDCIEHPGLDPEIRSHFEKTLDLLRAEGHTVTPVDFPFLDYMVPCYYVLTTAEASSNLSRYAGVLYGYRSKDANDLESTFKKSRTEGFGPEVKRRIMLGTFVLSSDYYDAYYTKAQKVRSLIRTKTDEILAQHDIIMLPTTSTPAFKLGEKAADPIAMYLADLFTVQANLAGIPAISIPADMHRSTGMPFGIQLMGGMYKDADLLSFSAMLAHKLEQNR